MAETVTKNEIPNLIILVIIMLMIFTFFASFHEYLGAGLRQAYGVVGEDADLIAVGGLQVRDAGRQEAGLSREVLDLPLPHL